MKKDTLKLFLFVSFLLFSFFLNAQTAPDEETEPITTCTDEGTNETRTSSDLLEPVNVGTIDDRSCYADYKESIIDGTTWGIYNITDGSNHFPESLQPRIERSLDRSQTSGIGSYARFTGTVRILEVGFTDLFFRDGSYIMQAKGKHSGGDGSPDPAICLFLAKPVFGKDDKGNDVQVSFDLYREQIIERGIGRTEVFLTNIKKNVPIDVVLEVGFREDPNDATKKIHYADAIIGGEVFNWNIPQPERGLQSGIRYGAYRVWGGRAQIRWANTTYEKKEVIEEVEENEQQNLIGKVFNLKNVATGKFLTHVGTVATPVIMSDSGEAANSYWSFVERGSFFNIDSQTFGVLRGTGSSFVDGAYAVVSTEREPPVTDNDKSWIIHHNEPDNTYRFESGSARFLYHEVSGKVTHLKVSETDNRSKWELVEIENPLSISQIEKSSFNLYPNPANKKFKIQFKNNSTIKSVEIYNFLGQRIYQNLTSSKFLKVNSSSFTKGVYLVKVSSENKKSTFSNLIIR
jgi:hypothetical protein